MLLHEYHAQMTIRERDHHLRNATEMARLHREAKPPEARRPFWARVRRHRPADAGPRLEPRPAYTR